MLKAVQNTNINNIKTSKTKCAEIHYISSSFTIVCLICTQISNEYHDFIKHYHDHHMEEFFQNLKENELHTNDPLQIQTKPQGLPQAEVVVVVKQEQVARGGQQQKQYAVKPIIDEELSDVYEDITGGELLYCKIEDGRATENIDSILHNTDDIPIDLEISENLSNNNSDKTCNEVDWSYSFKPNLLKLNQKRPYKPRNEPNSCSYCGKTFRRRYQLDTHLNIHTGLKPHQCDVCGRQFRAITTLQRHLSTHGKRKIFICKYCFKEFTHRAAFVSHETRHTQERCVPCDDCGKLFYTRNQLDTHKRKLHNKLDDNSLPYVCDLCPKRYRSASMLSTHKFKKHYKSAKYACEKCGKKFVDQHQLTIHLSIHVKKT